MNTYFLSDQFGGITSQRERYRLSRIATLCDPEFALITCSEYVVNRYFHPSQIIRCLTFEDAVAAVRHGHADFAVIPGAYPRVAPIIQSDDLSLTDIFVGPLPPLVFAGRAQKRPTSVSTLYCHAALESMIPDVKVGEIDEFQMVSSNAEASRSVANSTDGSACLTNALCTAAFGLINYQILREAQPMPFLIYGKRAPEAGTPTTPPLSPNPIISANAA